MSGSSYSIDRVRRIIRDGVLPSWTAQELGELLCWLDALSEEVDAMKVVIMEELQAV